MQICSPFQVKDDTVLLCESGLKISNTTELDDFVYMEACYKHRHNRKLQQIAKMHSGQGHTSLTIILTELKFIDHFVSEVAFIDILINQSVHFLHMTHKSSVVEACARFVLMNRKWITTKSNFHRIRHVNENRLCQRPGRLRQPNPKKLELPWYGKSVGPLIMHIHDQLWISILRTWLFINQCGISSISIILLWVSKIQ